MFVFKKGNQEILLLLWCVWEYLSSRLNLNQINTETVIFHAVSYVTEQLDTRDLIRSYLLAGFRKCLFPLITLTGTKKIV